MEQTKRPSIAGRVAIALLLMVGFYVLALAICGLLVLLLFAEFSGGFFNLYLTIFALFALAVIIWSILPRWDRFIPPGPLLTEERQPRLFKELRSISQDTHQAIPSEVYLLTDPNAFVAQRGGMLGMGSRRVMGIGLPLLKTLTVSEMKAVLTHEFGHYYGGDTSLGPLVYRTRATVIRTVSGLNWNSTITYLVRLPFYGYAKLYLRITQGVSRAQEYTADRLAGRVAGVKPTQQALRTIHGAAVAWNFYWRDEFVPPLVAGFVPPLADGFGHYLQSKTVAKKVAELVEAESRESKTNPYDSHPSLKDRIAALDAPGPQTTVQDDTPAISLIDGLEELEMTVLDSIARKNNLPALKTVSWDSLPALMYLPNLEKAVKEQKQFLAGLNPEQIPELAGNPDLRRGKLLSAESLTAEQSELQMQRVIGAALTLVLVKRGWKVQTGPGDPLYINLAGRQLDCFEVFAILRSKALSSEDWLNNCRQLGIEGIDLGALV